MGKFTEHKLGNFDERHHGPFPVNLPKLKDFGPNWLLSLSLGVLGVDRFHRGCLLTGILKLVTLGGAGFWWAWDLLAVAAGSAVEGEGIR